MKKILLFLTSIMLFIFSINTASAKTNDIKTKNLDFSVSLELPKNQEKGIESIFSLNVKPKQHQTVYINLKNNTSKPITVEMSQANALNSPSGGINYTNKRKDDYSQLIDSMFYMDNKINIPKEVNLKAYENKRIPITIHVPSIDQGTLLGGIIFHSKTVHSNSNSQGYSAKVSIDRTIAIKLNLSKEIKTVPLKISKVESENLGNRVNVAFNLENKNASIFQNVQINYEISKKGKMIFSGEIPSFNVAPKTQVKMQIPWNADEITQGKYHLKIKPTSQSEGISQDFSVTKHNLSTLSKQSGEKVVTPISSIPFYAYFVVILIIVGIVYCAYLFGTKRRKEEENNKRAA